MALDLADYDKKAAQAVRAFWRSRDKAAKKQKASGKTDPGGRAGVTAGKNMDRFADLICDIVRANGLAEAQIHRERAVLTLPGYFRPTKLWDILVTYRHDLIAAVELKSQVGPSFGNNFNNRTEEAIGTAHDFWTAYREGAFGQSPRPFVGWLMLVELTRRVRNRPSKSARLISPSSTSSKTLPISNGTTFFARNWYKNSYTQPRPS